MMNEFCFKEVTEDEKFYYTNAFKELIGREEITEKDKKEVLEKIYAMAYAYEKEEKKQEIKTDIIKKKVKEMKVR